ncbi:MAG TPA: hypothetical protein DDW36_02975 [Candidatus Magasanikbacteria bacterium]|nr:hypothetical protein [Candidatus Magasanikbacteria bacterium]
MKQLEQNKAIILRRSGYSLGEIACQLGVSKSTVSLWSRSVKLDHSARHRLAARAVRGREMANKNKKEKRIAFTEEVMRSSKTDLSTIAHSKMLDRLLCSLLYWCEGEKSNGVICFSNSDPLLVSTFLKFFRSGFALDEKKLRICLHLHEYHSEVRQKQFWSQVTAIPLNQFFKVYKKPHTGKRKKENYPGCVSVRYYDVDVAFALNALWRLFGQSHGRVG